MTIFASRSEAAGYLAAMIDGEGTVSERRRLVVIYNTDLSIIDATTVACEMLGIHCRVKRHKMQDGRKPMWNVIISRQSELIRLAESALPKSEAKRAALVRIVTGYRWSSLTARTPV
jgi:hypothetical protein